MNKSQELIGMEESKVEESTTAERVSAVLSEIDRQVYSLDGKTLKSLLTKLEKISEANSKSIYNNRLKNI